LPWWKKFLAMLGLTDDARVHVRAKGIDVVITGDPKLVRRVLEAVRSELENRGRKKRTPASSNKDIKWETDSHMVLPSELDEMDSPYIIPEHRPAGPVNELPGVAGTQVAGDADIVSSKEVRANNIVEPQSEPTAVEAMGDPMPVPKVTDGGRQGPESTTSESLEEFTDSGTDNITDERARFSETGEFTESGSDRGTDPDLSAEAELLDNPPR
jgi:hypothetical protein